MILVCGLPNAGKTTYSAVHKTVVHLDDIPCRTADEQYGRCIELVADSGDDVCVDGVYDSRKRRLDLLEAVGDKQGKRICVWLDTPAEVCITRENRHRPSTIIEHLANIFEPPTLDEGWDEIIIVRNNDEQ